MDYPHHEAQYPWNTSPAADAPRSVLPASHHQLSAPSSHRRRQQAGVVRPGDAVFPNIAGSHQPDEGWGDMPPSVDNTAAHGQQQDMGYYNLNMANEHPPLRDHRDHFIDNHGDFALDVPAQEPAIPSAPIDIFDGPARNTAASPTRVFSDEWPPQDRVPNGLANEVLRQLAILYLREPNARVTLIRMEPGHAHGVRVFIALDLADL